MSYVAVHAVNTHTHTHTQRERERETEREADRQTDRERERQTEREADRQTDSALMAREREGGRGNAWRFVCVSCASLPSPYL